MYELAAKRTEASLSIYRSIESSLSENLVRAEKFIEKYRDKCLSLNLRLENYKECADAECILSIVQRANRSIENVLELAQDMREVKSEFKTQNEQGEKKRKKRLVFSRIFLFFGFFSFFIIALFNSISMLLAPSQDVISVSAFAMVVFCYEFKDQSDEDSKTWQEKKRSSDDISNKLIGITNVDLGLDLLSLEIDQLIATHNPLVETDGKARVERGPAEEKV